MIHRVLLALLALSCTERGKNRPAARTEKPEFSIEFVEPEGEPRSSRPFLPGEALRIGLRIQRGSPPFAISIAGAPLTATVDKPPPLRTELRLQSSNQKAIGSLQVEVADASGERSSATQELSMLPENAVVHEKASSTRALQVVDLQGRERSAAFPGESLQIKARFNSDEKTVAVAILDPQGNLVAPPAEKNLENQRFSQPFLVPELARPGQYRIDLATRAETASATLDIRGPSFAPLAKPTIDSLQIFSGPESNWPRAGILKRGESYLLRARVGGIGARPESAAIGIRLRSRLGAVESTAKLSKIGAYDKHPRARAFAQINWQLPSTLAKGRYTLEVELTQAEQISALYREVLIE